MATRPESRIALLRNRLAAIVESGADLVEAIPLIEELEHLVSEVTQEHTLPAQAAR